MKIVFLDYLSRSGSTYLASLLDKYENIIVTIEGHKILYLYIKHYPIYSTEKLISYIDELFTDDKFLLWNIDKDKLLKKLLNISQPIKFQNIIEEIISLKYLTKYKTIIVIKGFDLYLFYNFIKNEFSNAQILFIIRDFRGIYNSQKTSIDSQKSRPMADDICVFLIRTKYSIAKLKGINDKMMIIKYEDLILDKDKTIEKILHFLGIEKRDKVRFENYFEKIPNSQKHLHKNILANPNIDRLNAWKSELDKKDAALIEIFLKRELAVFGYVPQQDSNIFKHPGLVRVYFNNLLIYIKYLFYLGKKWIAIS